MHFVLEYGMPLLFWFFLTFVILLIFGKKPRSQAILFRYLTIAYLVGICAVMLFPKVDFGIDSETMKPYFQFRFLSTNLRSLNLIPLRTIFAELSGNIPELGEADRLKVGIVNLFGCICLYIPVGFFLSAVFDNGSRLGAAFAVAVTFSVILEILQYFIGRVADVDDILLNLVGFFAGYGLYRLWFSLANRSHPAVS